MRIIERINKASSVKKAALLIGLAYLFSKLLGLYRDRLISSHFGVSGDIDAYTAAFRLPDLLFQILVSGAFAVAFMPLFMNYWSGGKKGEAWLFANKILNGVVFVTVVLGLVAFIFADPIVTAMSPGFDPSRHNLTVELTRIMLITPLLFGISSVFGSIQQAFSRFVLFSLSSAFYNVGIIIGVIFLSPYFGIHGVAYGVVIGAAIQAFAQIVGMLGLGYSFSLHLNFWDRTVGKFVTQVFPRSIDLGLDQINWIIQTIIGSTLPAGNIAALYYANNLRNVPVGIFGAAIATAVFPSLIEKARKGDKIELVKAFAKDVRMIMFFVVPAAAIAILMRGYIVRLILGFGDQLTADVLGSLAISIFSISLFVLVTRVFYALHDTWTPLWTSILAMVVNALLAITLVGSYGAVGLGLALSISSLSELLLLFYLLRRKLGRINASYIFAGAIRIAMATLGMSGITYWLVRYVFPLYAQDRGFFIVGPKFFATAFAAMVSYLVFVQLFKLHEAESAYRAVLAYVRKIRARRNGN